MPLYDFPSQFNCDIGGPNFFYIFMSLKYPPVTITWDNIDFDDVCRLRSFLTPIEHNLLDTPDDSYWTCTPSICLSESTSFQFDFQEESYGCVNAQDIGIYRVQELNNGTIGTIRGLLYESHTSQGNWGPCAHIIISDVEEALINEKIEIEIYPNPTSDIIKIKNQNEGKWERMEIFTAEGKVISSQEKQENDLSFSFKNYPSGIYFLNFFDSKSQFVYSKRVIKM